MTKGGWTVPAETRIRRGQVTTTVRPDGSVEGGDGRLTRDVGGVGVEDGVETRGPGLGHVGRDDRRLSSRRAYETSGRLGPSSTLEVPPTGP